MKMKEKIERYFTSGWDFSEDEYVLKSKFQMMNIGIILASASMLYGMVLNFIMGKHALSFVELCLFFMNIGLALLLRRDKKYILPVAHIETGFMTILILYLIYFVNPIFLKHVWIFTYPIVILYFTNEKHALYWMLFLLFMVLISPLQPFIQTPYSLSQIITLTFVFAISTLVVYFYHLKMQEARALIYSQSKMLKQKIAELTKKDKIMTVQSRQAVMGEMISMIAHQWRQPLSSVTLSISNLQVKRLLGEKCSDKEIDTTLENISNTVVYLSDTINDFQTYFHPKKEPSHICVDEIIERAVNFTMPRIQEHQIVLNFLKSEYEEINTYTNELIQVLLNILNNAIDQLMEQKIPQPFINIYLQEDAKCVTIAIHDNAGGISQEHIDSIFDPYFSTKGKNGTGLGLYMSQMIMQKQFGTSIEVVSKNSETTFKVHVPKKLA